MRHRYSHPTGHCYHWVKQAIYASGLAPTGSLTGGYARLAESDLENRGFENILPYLMEQASSWRQVPHIAPIGAILVFDGDSHYRAGDVAIKTPTGYVSDYFSPRPITEQWNGMHFRLAAVMVKSQPEENSDSMNEQSEDFENILLEN